MNALPQAALCFFLCLTCLPGCRKKQTDAIKAQAPASEVAASVGVQTADLPTQEVLYKAITKYTTANQGHAAKDVEELVAKGYLKPLPALPPGKRYYLDQRSAVLKIGD